MKIGLVTIVFMISIVDNRVVSMPLMIVDHIPMMPLSNALQIIPIDHQSIKHLSRLSQPGVSQFIKHLYKLYNQPGVNQSIKHLYKLNQHGVNLLFSSSLHMIHKWYNKAKHICNQACISNLLTHTNQQLLYTNQQLLCINHQLILIKHQHGIPELCMIIISMTMSIRFI